MPPLRADAVAAETAEESVAEKPFEKYENRANNLDKTRKA